MARILVVDDDADVRALVRDVLELEGHDVELAVDGYAALRAVVAERPDGVVLDVQMPGMDGHEVLARLRATADGRELRVVLLSAVVDDATAWRAWAGGADHLLAKPFEPADLLRLLDRLPVAARSAGAAGSRC